MPQPFWKHYCGSSTYPVWLGKEYCDECGARGEYDGWRYSRLESMAAYSRRTGLKPIGTHRWLADLLLSPMLTSCPDCDGRGITELTEYEWNRCEGCQGMRTIRCVPAEEFAVTRQRALKEFPDAASGVWLDSSASPDSRSG